MKQSRTSFKKTSADKLHDSLFFWSMAKDFLYVHLTQVRNMSERTATNYRDGLRDYTDKFLITYKKIARTSVCIADCSSNNAREYMKWLSADRGLSPKTVCSRMNALRCFLEYASMKDTIVTSYYLAVKEIGLPKTDSGKIEHFESHQMDAIIDAVDTSTKVGRRNRMMLVLLYDIAARAAELLDLTVNSLHLDAEVPFVTIAGKGRKYRNIPLMNGTVKALKTYLIEFHKNSGKTVPLFYAVTHGSAHRLSYDTLANLLEACCRKTEADGMEMPEHRHRQEQLQHREVHGVGVHGEEVRQGQGWQAKGQHLPHGHIQQHRGEHRRRDELGLPPPQCRRLRVLGVLDRGGRRVLQVEGGAEAGLLHLGDDLLLGTLGLVIVDGHDAGGQVHLAALHARQLPGDPLHRRTARRAVHPGDVVLLFPHDRPPFCRRGIPSGGILFGSQYIPLRGICQGPIAAGGEKIPLESKRPLTTGGSMI